MKLLIKRFLNNKIYFDEYAIEVKQDETILEVLDKIRDFKDRSLTYRSFCRSSICGTCTIKVNDKTVLACKSKVKDLVQNNELIIEAVDRVNVIKDLVVDNSFIEEKLKKVRAYFINGKSKNFQTVEEYKKLDKQSDCILCGACFYECEALDFDKNFAGPFAFSKIFKFVFDSKDKEDKQKRIETLKENGLYSCINCQKCIMVCPKNLTSAYDIKTLQQFDKNPPFEDNFNMNFF